MKATKSFIFQFLLIATLSISALSLLGVVCGYSNGGLILSNLNFELESFNTDSYISKDGIVYLGPYDYNEYINNLTKGGMINE